MTALVLTAVAGAASKALGLTGFAAGALNIGAAIAGRAIDTVLLSRPTTAEGPRLDNLEVTTSAEGDPIPRVFGRVKVGGEIIWATNFEEVRSKKTQGGGKGGPRSTTITYSYYANFAVALAEGEVAHVGRVWADGEEIELEGITWRFYSGSGTQDSDPLIEAVEGDAPAYRGTAYIVFEQLPLEDFGNRIPQLSFEIYRPVGQLETALKAVDIIPGAGEFAYDTTPVRRQVAGGEYDGANVTSTRAGSDWTVSLDELQALAPNVAQAALVVTWFGTDLRVGQCQVEPRVDQAVKVTAPETWGVAGLDRASANVVSEIDGVPAFGGTPNDAGVVRAITDLKARGLGVTFYPFVMMDVPAGNGLSDPYGGAEQAAYPWRGRITCDPAPGQPGSPDKSAAAATQLAAFVGTAAPGDFSVSGTTVTYSGPAEWTLRRMVLHYAHLCVAAGGVDAFVIGSELIGLTQLRDGAASYPFVQALVALAADVRAVLGAGTKIGYAADWSEYHNHRPADGSGDVFFNLDPLWSDANIDFIGIDNYLPLADWRDGFGHLDAADSTVSPRDPAYLATNVEGGEYYDWYYASDTDRLAQTRTAIADTAYAKDWVFRQKDIRNWWANAHVDRPGGVESAATGWTPQSKPVWFTELGCPAVDKGANQPNVFVDPKSSESAVPHFSTGARDDMMARRALEAVIGYWAANNPASAVYSDVMIPDDRIYVWAWDARAFPAFPADTGLWADALNWDRGHWLNGRLGTAPVGELVTAILSGYPAAPFATDGMAPAVDGYVIDRVMSARDALSPLENAFALDILESGDSLKVASRLSASVASFAEDDLALAEDARDGAPPVTRTRAQETELAAIARVTIFEPFDDYRAITLEAVMPDVASDRVATSSLPAVMAPEIAQALAEEWLHASRARRETAAFALPPSALALEPGDVVALTEDTATTRFRIEEVAEEAGRAVKAVLADRAPHAPAPGPRRRSLTVQTAVSGPALFAFLDLPLLTATAEDTTLYAAAHAIPWEEGIAVYRSPADAGYALETVIGSPAIIGETLTALAAGPLGVWDNANSVDVSISSGILSSLDNLLVLSGENALAIETADGWEILQFATADLLATRTYRLSRLLRGQLGTDRVLGAAVPAGARIVLLDVDVAALALSADKVGVPAYWKIGLAGRAFDDASYQTLQHTPAGEGRRPFSPVHARAVRDPATGDIALTWIRRTRIDGDSWEQAEVPLGEESEAYALTIRDAGSVVLETSVTSPAFDFNTASQTTAFGAPLSPGDPLDVEISQVSATFGAGASLRTTLLV
ncbi:MAG: glycoside hydrolase/phage tail family protein [Rhodobiaceae bacterium]|nr:glycoside hydrolase/phage tail family protein [Rhodobiaceae bacterium]